MCMFEFRVKEYFLTSEALFYVSIHPSIHPSILEIDSKVLKYDDYYIDIQKRPLKGKTAFTQVRINGGK